jgi:tRNA pseudouridine55 synthase
MQAPPAFSAVKVEGRRAYKMARAGAAPEVPPRPVTVHELELVAYDWPHVDLAIRCAKGFYVRSLARDLGRAVGTGGHCLTIRRTAVGPFTEAMAVPLDDLPDTIDDTVLLPVDRALALVGGEGD